MTSPTSQYTDFSKDVLGRYVCNGLDEALRSTSGRPDAQAFDIVIVGGGSFGGALAQHALYSDKFRNHRILVLEAGPFLLAEHTQNLPTLGLVAPGPTTVDPGVPRVEVWGLPWRTDVPKGFPGLAYCVVVFALSKSLLGELQVLDRILGDAESEICVAEFVCRERILGLGDFGNAS